MKKEKKAASTTFSPSRSSCDLKSRNSTHQLTNNLRTPNLFPASQAGFRPVATTSTSSCSSLNSNSVVSTGETSRSSDIKKSSPENSDGTRRSEYISGTSDQSSRSSSRPTCASPFLYGKSNSNRSNSPANSVNVGGNEKGGVKLKKGGFYGSQISCRDAQRPGSDQPVENAESRMPTSPRYLI